MEPDSDPLARKSSPEFADKQPELKEQPEPRQTQPKLVAPDAQPDTRSLPAAADSKTESGNRRGANANPWSPQNKVLSTSLLVLCTIFFANFMLISWYGAAIILTSLLYALPIIIATVKGRVAPTKIACINLLGGLTIFCYLIALWMAIKGKQNDNPSLGNLSTGIRFSLITAAVAVVSLILTSKAWASDFLLVAGILQAILALHWAATNFRLHKDLAKCRAKDDASVIPGWTVVLASLMSFGPLGIALLLSVISTAMRIAFGLPMDEAYLKLMTGGWALAITGSVSAYCMYAAWLQYKLASAVDAKNSAQGGRLLRRLGPGILPVAAMFCLTFILGDQVGTEFVIVFQGIAMALCYHLTKTLAEKELGS